MLSLRWSYLSPVYFWLGRYCTNQLISLSGFPVIYGLLYEFLSLSSKQDILNRIETFYDLNNLPKQVSLVIRVLICSVIFGKLSFWTILANIKSEFVDKSQTITRACILLTLMKLHDHGLNKFLGQYFWARDWANSRASQDQRNQPGRGNWYS